MDLVALLQVEVGVEYIGVHPSIKTYVHQVGYLSQETKCTPQVFGGFTQSCTKASDTLQAKKSGRGVCRGMILGKHRPKGRVTKWFKEKRAP